MGGTVSVRYDRPFVSDAADATDDQFDVILARGRTLYRGMRAMLVMETIQRQHHYACSGDI
jgi:hypothetical protein